MSSRGVGNAAENRAEKELEANGYLVERARPDLRWIGPGRCRSMAHDIFGAFDLFAVKANAADSSEDRIRLIQVTAGSGVNERRMKVAAMHPKMPYEISLEVWRWRGGRAKKTDRIKRGWIKEYLDRIRLDWVEMD